MNENALMMALGKSFESYNNNTIQNCVVSYVCNKIKSKSKITDGDDIFQQILR